jgi:hypothetical protein
MTTPMMPVITLRPPLISEMHAVTDDVPIKSPTKALAR